VKKLIFRKGQRVRLVNNSGMAAVVGAEAVLLENCLGDGYLARVHWEEGPLRRGQGDGGYSASKFEKIKKTQTPKSPDLLEALIEAVRSTFPDDAPAPGVVFSKIPGGFYVSVRRYENWKSVGAGGTRICCDTETTLEAALRSVAKAFHAKHAPPPKSAFDVLKGALK
jgi:hypothetical protein